MKDRRYGKWADLPPELISSILLRLETIEILENAQKVCRSWRGVCRDPSMWRKIDMHNLENLSRLGYGSDDIMCRHAVDRSQGGLLEIDIWYFVTDELVSYIADRSSNLRSLRLVMCNGITNTGLVETVAKLPLLEYLEVSDSVPSGEFLKVAGESCPNLKTLKLNYTRDHSFDDDDDAMAIAESMPELRDLQICGNGLTDKGLNAILDGCPHLKSLDLRHCFNVELVGDLRKRVYERIEDLRHPDDFLADCPFDDLSGHSFVVEEEGVVEVELGSDDDYSYHSDEYIYDMSDDVDNHPDTYDD